MGDHQLLVQAWLEMWRHFVSVDIKTFYHNPSMQSARELIQSIAGLLFGAAILSIVPIFGFVKEVLMYVVIYGLVLLAVYIALSWAVGIAPEVMSPLLRVAGACVGNK